MINIPLTFTTLYLLIGIIVSMYAMASDKFKIQHHVALDLDNIPEFVRPLLLTVMAFFYMLFWPMIIDELR